MSDGVTLGEGDVICFPGTIEFTNQSTTNDNPLS